MSTKSVMVAVILIGLGIIFGVVMVSSFKGVDLSFAGENVRLRTDDPPARANATLQSLNEAFHAVAKTVTPSVVYIRVETKGETTDDEEGQKFFHFFGPDFKFDIPRHGPEVGAGSGVILTPSGYILTNNHVVENAKNDGIKVQLSDTREFRARLVGTDSYTDIAVVKIDASDLPAAALGNSDDVEVGHIVFALGNPLGLNSTMTEGIVSFTGRGGLGIVKGDQGYGIENFIQTDAAVNPGNSGGALVDINGSVIGINTAIATTNARYQGYSFAIPINLAKKVATDLIKYGKVRRGYIGVEISPVDAVTAKAQGLDRAKGVIVQTVRKNSGGEEAGIEQGDIILSVDGREVSAPNALQSIVAGKSPGESVTLKIWRDKSVIEKKVTLRPRGDEEVAVRSTDTKRNDSRGEDAAAERSVAVDPLGLTVRPLDEAAKKTFDVDHGVYVENVEPLGPAGDRGLQKGTVILSIGNEKVTSARQFDSAVKKLKPGDAVMLRVKREDKRIVLVPIEIPE